MNIGCFDDFIWGSEVTPKQQSVIDPLRAIIENHNGDQMFIAKEVDMSINTSAPLTLGWAVGLCVATVISVLVAACGTYAFLQSDITSLRTEIGSVRDSAGADNSSLRSDMKLDFNRTNDKLDKISATITEVRVNQAKKD
ncbi:hypothetical protein [Yersinia sp. 22-579]|uniref:hypothetical protein n=1 Tax=Yersinia sp. 22-579 TaxID=3057580 RepID=UPI00263AF666|nr:hypothetical protein [Yersinia sp. 22-579]